MKIQFLKSKHVEFFLLFVAHIILLAYMIFVVTQLGQAKMSTVFTHFVILGLYGGGLIRLCAFLAKKRWKKGEV